MSRYERSKFFDKLIELRAAYDGRDTTDLAPVMSIGEVEAFAAHVFAVAGAAMPVAVEAATSDHDTQS